MADAEHAAADLVGPAPDGPLLALLRLLADGASSATLGVAVAEGLLRECAPTQVSAYFLDPTQEWLDERVRYTLPDHDDDFGRVPVGVPLPLTEAVRTGEERALTLAEAADAYPTIAGWVRAQPDRADEQVLIVPIRREGKPVGALLVALPAGAERTWRLRVLLDAAATALAVWSRGLTPDSGGTPRASRARGILITPRQTRIIEAVRGGASNAQIAAELGVSVGTVKADLAQLYRMFGVNDRESLASLATQPD